MSDMSIDGCDEITDSVYGQWPLEVNPTTLWNGREVTVIQKRDERYDKILEIIHAELTQEPPSLEDRQIWQLLDKTLEELLEENDCFFDLTKGNIENAKSFIEHLKRAAKEVKKGLEKAAKTLKKLAEKTAEVVKKAIHAIAHGTKKAEEKVEKFVKEHKKETLIAIAVLAAIAGAVLLSGTLGSTAAAAAGGAASGGGSKKREDEEDGNGPAPSSPPSDPPSLPDWMTELVKSTAPDFLNKPSETSLDDAKKQAHDAWDLFDRLKLETERDLASLKEFEPQFNPSSKAIETIFNSVLNEAQFEASKNSLISRGWPEVFRAGHEKIDHAFETYSAQFRATVAPQAQPISLVERIQMGLEIIRQGMTEPNLLNPNSPIDSFFNESQKKFGNEQTITHFFEALGDTLKADSVIEKPTGPHPFLKYITSPFDPSFPPLTGIIAKSLPPLFPLSEPQPSRYFETEGIKRKDMMITCTFGMANTLEDAKKNLDHLKQLSNSDLCIEGIYNHTNGAIADLSEIFLLNYHGYSPNTQSLIRQKWIDFHVRNWDNPYAKILHFCSSQGAIHTKNALNGLPKVIRDRIIVIAIAPAVVISDELCYQSFNYASEKDIVHRGEDVMACIALLGAALHDEDTTGADTLRQQIADAYLSNKAQLILLKPHEGATGLDHEFISPTFDPYIGRHLDDYSTDGI